MWNELFITFNTPSLFLETLSEYTQATERKLVRLLKMRETTQHLLKIPEMPFLVVQTGEIIEGGNTN